MSQDGIFLLEVDAWTGSQVERFRLSTKSFCSSPNDTPPNTLYDGRINDIGVIGRSLFESGGTIGKAASAEATITLSNADGKLDPWLDYGFSGRRLSLMHLDQSATVVFRGTVRSLETSDAPRTMRLRIRDRLAEMERPLLTTRYAGTTTAAGPTAEGDEDLAGTLKPRVIGSVLNVPGKLVNKFNLLYQFSDGPSSLLLIYDGGVPLTYKGNVGSLSALIAGTLAPGEYATCTAQSIARLGVPALRAVTAVVDDVGNTDQPSLRSAAKVVGRMLDASGVTERDSASFNAADAFNAAEVGIYVDNDASILDLCGRILESIGLGFTQSNEGLLQLAILAAPTGAPVKTFTLRDIGTEGQTWQMFSSPGNEGDGVPCWSYVLDWGRIWHVQTASDLGGDPTSPTDPVGGTGVRDFLGRAVRQSVVQNPSIKTAHLLASEITSETLLRNKADADAEVARRFARYSVRRDHVGLPISFDAGRSIQIGNVVSLDIDRFGYAGGKLFRVVGRRDNFAKKQITLDLWG